MEPYSFLTTSNNSYLDNSFKLKEHNVEHVDKLLHNFDRKIQDLIVKNPALNNIFKIQQIEELVQPLSNILLKEYKFDVHELQHPRRRKLVHVEKIFRQIFNVSDSKDPYFQQLNDIYWYLHSFFQNEAPTPQETDQGIYLHSKARVLLYFGLCQVYAGMQTDIIRTIGSKMQLETGRGDYQACHHSLMSEVKDNFLIKFSDKIELFLLNARNQEYFDFQTALLLLVLGVPGDRLSGVLKDFFLNNISLAEASASLKNGIRTEATIDDQQSSYLLGSTSIFYFLNNHTLKAPAIVNQVDNLIENQVRVLAENLLKNVAADEMNPWKAVERLKNELGTILVTISSSTHKLLNTIKLLEKFETFQFDNQFNADYIELIFKDLEEIIPNLDDFIRNTPDLFANDHLDNQINLCREFYKVNIHKICDLFYINLKRNIQDSKPFEHNVEYLTKIKTIDSEIESLNNKKNELEEINQELQSEIKRRQDHFLIHEEYLEKLRNNLEIYKQLHTYPQQALKIEQIGLKLKKGVHKLSGLRMHVESLKENMKSNEINLNEISHRSALLLEQKLHYQNKIEQKLKFIQDFHFDLKEANLFAGLPKIGQILTTLIHVADIQLRGVEDATLPIWTPHDMLVNRLFLLSRPIHINNFARN